MNFEGSRRTEPSRAFAAFVLAGWITTTGSAKKRPLASRQDFAPNARAKKLLVLYESAPTER